MAEPTDKFDPYHKWLGIPPREQPPNHYRLLGLQPFESDAEVIEAAASRLIAYCESQATGAHAAEARRLVVQLASARLCLLEPEQRAAYDAKLRAKAAAKPNVAAPLPEANRAAPVRRATPGQASATSRPAAAAKPPTPQPGVKPSAPQIQIQTGPRKVAGQVPQIKPTLPRPVPPQSAAADANELDQMFGNAMGGDASQPSSIDELASLGIEIQSDLPQLPRSAGKPSRGRTKDSGSQPKVGGTDKSMKKRKQQRQLLLVGGMALGAVVLIIAGVVVVFSGGDKPASKPALATARASAGDDDDLDHDELPADDAPINESKDTADADSEDSLEIDEPTEDNATDMPAVPVEGSAEAVDEQENSAAAPSAGKSSDAAAVSKQATERLLEVCQRGGTDPEVKKLVADGADLAAIDADRRTPLRLAVMNRQLPIVRVLIAAKAEVNTADARGETPLMSAAQLGDARLITMLLSAGADANAVTVGANSGITALHLAARNGHAEVAQLLIQGEASIDAATQEGKTPLMLAAWQGHEEVVEVLIEKGANVKTVVDREGQSPLMHAAHGGNLSIVDTLLQRGAIANQKSSSGATALAIALGAPQPNLAVVNRLRAASEAEAPEIDF